MTENKFQENDRVIHKIYKEATIQPLYKVFHPNLPDDMCYIKCDNWPCGLEGEPLAVDVLLVFMDDLTKL